MFFYYYTLFFFFLKKKQKEKPVVGQLLDDEIVVVGGRKGAGAHGRRRAVLQKKGWRGGNGEAVSHFSTKPHMESALPQGGKRRLQQKNTWADLLVSQRENTS